jgi:sRNA-binding carbon storage regulator CsrA
MHGAGNLLLTKDQAIMGQAISMREAQVRIGVNVPRHRGEVNSYNSYNNNNNNGGFSRNNNRGRGSNYNKAQRGGEQRNQTYQKTANNYSTSANAPTSEPNAGVRD